jgi:hypothetical protein
LHGRRGDPRHVVIRTDDRRATPLTREREMSGMLWSEKLLTASMVLIAIMAVVGCVGSLIPVFAPG